VLTRRPWRVNTAGLHMRDIPQCLESVTHSGV
jgi:hypothetical protein